MTGKRVGRAAVLLLLLAAAALPVRVQPTGRVVSLAVSLADDL